MQAIRVHPSPDGPHPYTPSNPAPSSSLHLDKVPLPKPSTPGEILLKIKASTIIRDTLTWPETYTHEYTTPGNDLSGVVIDVFGDDPNSTFKPGDAVFGMLPADQPGSWAEYAIVSETSIAHKPTILTWEEAAAAPLSGMTAYEALFLHASVPVPGNEEAVRNWKREGRLDPDSSRTKLLLTGAAGAVGVYLVQLARLAGLHVTAATRSNERNAEFLRELGVDDTIEYAALHTPAHESIYDIVIDTVGGQPLVDAWACIKGKGSLVSVDSSSFNFVEEHATRGIAREGVKALFFIVQGVREGLDALAHFAQLGILRVFVLDTYPLEKVQEAYDRANGRLTGRGKIILRI
ncbi:hypothetical protein BJX76DRAFT_339893 [Aspergillus varians]